MIKSNWQVVEELQALRRAAGGRLPLLRDAGGKPRGAGALQPVVQGRLLNMPNLEQVIVVGIILVLMLVPVLTAVREQGAVQEPEGPTLD